MLKETIMDWRINARRWYLISHPGEGEYLLGSLMKYRKSRLNSPCSLAQVNREFKRLQLCRHKPCGITGNLRD